MNRLAQWHLPMDGRRIQEGIARSYRRKTEGKPKGRGLTDEDARGGEDIEKAALELVGSKAAILMRE